MRHECPEFLVTKQIANRLIGFYCRYVITRLPYMFLVHACQRFAQLCSRGVTKEYPLSDLRDSRLRSNPKVPPQTCDNQHALPALTPA